MIPHGWLRLLTSLRVRLAVLLSIAILPLGLVAVVQTQAVVREAEELEREDVTARTLRAANVERAVLRRAFGAAAALGTAATALGSDRPECTQIMRDFADSNDRVIFAGFTDIDGVMRCSSGERIVDFNGIDDWNAFMEDPHPTIGYSAAGAVSGLPVLVASVPAYAPLTGELTGVASVSLPGGLLEMTLHPDFDKLKLALLTEDGSILASSVTADRFAPFDVVPGQLNVPDTGLTRMVRTPEGAEHLAVLVPLLEGRAFVLGIWDGPLRTQAVSLLGTTAPVFPVLMWLIALGVGIFAMDRLVLRHLKVLRGRMSRFSFETPDDSYARLTGAPPEIAAIAGTYNRMVDRLLADRAELAQALDEKEVLLREVHHRVKNNLQLIASMISIQMRKVPGGPTRHILQRMQDRVMSLSSIHKTLYAGTTLKRVRADHLLEKAVQSGLFIGLPAGSGVETRVDLAQMDLDPDLAVPLTLLAGELATNAVKYVGRRPDGAAHLHISLTARGADAVLVVENSMGAPVQPVEATEGTGLGANLIEAFVSQLGAEIEVVSRDDLYRVQVICPGLRTDAGPPGPQDAPAPEALKQAG